MNISPELIDMLLEIAQVCLKDKESKELIMDYFGLDSKEALELLTEVKEALETRPD